MALRAFQSNPSIGGFGAESHFGGLGPSRFGPSQSSLGDKRHDSAGRKGGDAASRTTQRLSNANTDPAAENGGQFVAGSCDAFAQIVKELVDNAVDACAPVEIENDVSNRNGDANQKKIMKRVRVTMTAVKVSVRTNDNENDSGTLVAEDSKTMDCLRIEVSDNGCGMENIDDCVSAFTSNKNGATMGNADGGEGRKAGEKSGEATQSNAKKKKVDKKQKSFDSNENYTSGRYGVGLTLCLLHAQRLVPGTGACITSATASAAEWTRATYEPDTGADNIVCKKKETFPKLTGEFGTTISLLVPGGEEAQRAWPRLAEYFARFQLSINLPCSLEVKAPTLQSRPLYIRPPAEMERRINRKRGVPLAVDSLMDGSEANNDDDEFGDGFDEGKSPDLGTNYQEPKTSKAARQRAEAELQKKKKISLICKAASAYKRRPDLNVEKVAYTTQHIRRAGSGHSNSSKNGPVLEVGLIVFGPEPEDADNDSDGSEHGSCPQSQTDIHQSNDKSSAKLQVVRMVNGIPLLDSSEALACGVVQKISNNAATWNSFGLNIVQNSENDLDHMPVNEQNTPTFEINDSAQVAPFLKSTTHSLFQDQSQDYDQSSSDEDDFDIENIRGKRKKERQVKCILPAALRLGDVLMVVQIRAKPSALPLPTLSKGRLPLNDKGISDALENGISDCLRCLQRSSPGLLLTAQQLKRVERDVKYVPSIAGAIASVLCRSKQKGGYDNTMNRVSVWDDEVKRMGVLCSGNELDRTQRRRRARTTVAERSYTPMKSQADEERLRVDALRPILERRLRFVISDEFKDAKKVKEKEKQRREREKLAAAKKRAKKNKAVESESDGMKSDCFESDGGSGSEHSTLAELTRDRCPKKSSRDGFDSDMSSPVAHSRRRRLKGRPVSSSVQSSVASSRQNGMSPRGDVDSHTSSSVGRTRRRRFGGSIGSSEHPSTGHSQGLSTPDVHTERLCWKQNGEHPSVEGSRKDVSSPKSLCGNFDSGMSSPFVWKGNSVGDFGDGYESSPRLSNRQLEDEKSVSNAQGSNLFSRGRPSNDRVQSDGSGTSPHSQNKSAQGHEDTMSSDSEWSSQYGEVVPGHFFR